MDYNNLNIRVKHLMYYLYNENYEGKHLHATYEEFFKYEYNLRYYYKLSNIELRKEKINKIKEKWIM